MKKIIYILILFSLCACSLQTSTDGFDSGSDLESQPTDLQTDWIQERDGYRVEILEVFVDAWRFSVTYRVTIPEPDEGYLVSCPVSENLLKIEEEEIYLYTNSLENHSEEIAQRLDSTCMHVDDAENEFIVMHNYWPAGFETQWLEDRTESLPISMHVQSGDVSAWNGTNTISLPEGPSFGFDFLLQPQADRTMIFSDLESEQSGITVQLTSLAFSEKYTLAGLCIEFQDDHVWRLDAVLSSGNQTAMMERSRMIKPENAQVEDLGQYSQRCFRLWFDLDYDFVEESDPLHMKLHDLVSLTNNRITAQKCMDVVESVKRDFPTAELHCELMQTPDGDTWWYYVTKPADNWDFFPFSEYVSDQFLDHHRYYWNFGIQYP